MPGMFGADVAELRDLAKRMSAGQRALQSKAIDISSMVNTSAWEGADGDQFRQDWNSNLKKQVLQSARFLDVAATELRRHAQEQEKASNGAGASSGGTTIPAGRTTAGQATSSSPLDRAVDTLGTAIDWGAWGDVGNVTATTLGIASDMKIDAAKAAGLLDEAGRLKPGLAGAGILDGLKGLSALGNVASGLSVLDGAVSAYQGFDSGNPYAGADGVITGVLGAASFIPGPVGWTAAGLGMVWTGLDYLSGDVPVTKRIVDFGESAANAIADGAEAAWDWAFG